MLTVMETGEYQSEVHLIDDGLLVSEIIKNYYQTLNVVVFGYVWHCCDLFDRAFDFLVAFVLVVMASRSCNPRTSIVGLSQAAKETMDATDCYHIFVPDEDKALMPALEVEVQR